VSAHKQIN